MNLTVSSSPHIRGKDTTRRLMLDVIIALAPALIAGVVVFGLRALLVTLVTVIAAVAGEWLYRKLTRQRDTVLDLSAVVTGLLLALTLPATVPYWVAALGGLFATVVVKALCGGLGQNAFNPALAARALLVLLFPVWLTRFAAAGAELPLGGMDAADVVSTATPLRSLQMGLTPSTSLADAFLGNMTGCIGEVSALALLVGGAYLVFRRVISYRIPAAYLGSVAVVSLLLAKGEDPLSFMCYSLLTGGVMLGAIFMATDYASSPVAPKAQWVYGVGCGILTVLFRSFGLFPEGVTYAILLMNAASWLLDKCLADRIYGFVEKKEEKAEGEGMDLKTLIPPVGGLVLAAALLAVVTGATRGTSARAEEDYRNTVFPYLTIGGSQFTQMSYEGSNESVKRVWKADNDTYVVEAASAGYVDDVTVWVGLTDQGQVTGVMVWDAGETYGLGQKARNDRDLLASVLGSSGSASVDAITGATITSRAVGSAVNAAARCLSDIGPALGGAN